MTIDYLHHDSITTAAVTECGSVSCADCQLSRKTNAGWYCARLQRVVNLDGCIYFSQKVVPKPKPITNADRIRSMSDEELAEWLDARVSDCPWCNPNAPVKPGTNECEIFECRLCALDWLREEASDVN